MSKVSHIKQQACWITNDPTLLLKYFFMANCYLFPSHLIVYPTRDLNMIVNYMAIIEHGGGGGEE
jgi:hypothetical protein